MRGLIPDLLIQLKFVDQSGCSVLYNVVGRSFKKPVFKILPHIIDQLPVIITEEPVRRLFLKFLFHNVIDEKEDFIAAKSKKLNDEYEAKMFARHGCRSKIPV
jgi:hypothetical protein